MLSNITKLYRLSNTSFIPISKITMENSLEVIKLAKPSLSSKTLHKGQAGRIGIVGGSIEYTGAPYFAGISALKAGADLVHIFCINEAAKVIKSYSPELIVHPLLDSYNATDLISPWLDRINVLVIGPGLGRDPAILKVVTKLIALTEKKKIPLVVDADGLFLLSENPGLFKEYPAPGVVLTPNKVEFERIKETVGDNSLGENVLVLKKGETDEFISNCPSYTWSSNLGGTGRRCGGQGDILSGSIATFLNWAIQYEPDSKKAISAACYSASRLVRLCNENAFAKKGRSMLAVDMIEEIHKSFETLFEQ